MPKFSYVALDSRGKETKGTIEVASQSEAITRIKDMGLHPTRVVELDKGKQQKPQEKTAKPAAEKGAPAKKGLNFNINLNIKIPFLGGKVKP
jgi:type IV pilus assembly protein PilC